MISKAHCAEDLSKTRFRMKYCLMKTFCKVCCADIVFEINFYAVTFASPICIPEYSKTLLGQAVWNDTAFLSSLNVMDYSLLVGIDSEKNELVVGIIGTIGESLHN